MHQMKQSKAFSVVAFGAGAVAIRCWLGWKAYAKLSAKIVQVNGSNPAAVGEVNIVPPEDDERVTRVPEAAGVDDLDQGPKLHTIVGRCARSLCSGLNLRSLWCHC
ncbi:Uncharacterized protein APZ42_018998 [Daphnia magna]|uniref:Uncharacterized protein n=1 Tax=Daphnia magna TaxID=35525 RepID=A0A162CQA7_9CRUS|nr:Uncharacterized protein APZ42_018998 [Daphnia magna]